MSNTHKTQLTVAIIGLIGVLGAAVIANWDKIFPQGPPRQIPSEGSPQDAKDGVPDSAASGCLNQYLSGLPQDRITALEAGAKDFQVIGPHQSKDRAIALRLQENRQPVGALKFQFYLNNTIFKIESVVDSKCQPVEDYTNASRGGDKHILQNWDDLRVRLGDALYELSLEYGEGRIDANFIRISPEKIP